jgi:hypothetical protein
VRCAGLTLPLLVVCLGGCLDGRRAVDVPADAGPLEALDQLSLPDGTTLSIATADLVFEDVLFEEPAVATRWPALIRSAQAHAGHDYSGAETGELSGRYAVDLTAGITELGTARLLEGSFATARMQWPVDAPAAVIEGSATPPGAAPIPFRFVIQEERTVSNMPFLAEVDPDAPPAALQLRVDLARILGESDWSTPDQDGDGVLTAADGALDATIRFGVRTSAAYAWEIER